MTLLFSVLLIFFALLSAYELYRRFPKIAVFMLVLLLFSLAPYWIAERGIKDWFLWAKVFSVVALTIWITALRIFPHLNEKKYAKLTIYILLSINIFEAVFKDLTGESMAHYFNAAAGILSVLTIGKIYSMDVDKDRKRDFHWSGLTLMWVIGNTLWDWTFVYLNYYGFSAQHFAVLGVPLFIEIINRGKWLQARAFTLSVYTIFIYTLHITNQSLYSNWTNKFFEYAIAEISLIFMIVYAIIFLRSKSAKIG